MRKEIVTLVSDLSNVAADETLRFALDGAEYEIDLTESETANLRAAIRPYIDAGRRVGGRRRATTKTAVASAPEVNGFLGEAGAANTG